MRQQLVTMKRTCPIILVDNAIDEIANTSDLTVSRSYILDSLTLLRQEIVRLNR